MAFKKQPRELLRNQVWFQLLYFFGAEAIIFLGVYLKSPGISSIGGMIIAIPLFFFFFGIFEHVVSGPRNEVQLLPDVRPPGVPLPVKEELDERQ